MLKLNNCIRIDSNPQFFFLLLMSIFIYEGSYSQTTLNIKKDWQNFDFKADGLYGISTNKAYEFLKGKNKDTIVVAIIDSGIDTLHEDLKDVLWCNLGEKGNDEDQNGYKNDRRGWNFLGTVDGGTFSLGNREYNRMYLQHKSYFNSHLRSNIQYSNLRQKWVEAKERFIIDSSSNVTDNIKFQKQILKEDSLLREYLHKEEYTILDIRKAIALPNFSKYVQISSFLRRDTTLTNKKVLSNVDMGIKTILTRYTLNPLILRRQYIGDDFDNLNCKLYGNNLVMGNGGASVRHGTHVAGIVAAKRGNGLGIDGIADAVKIMTLKVVSSGSDEYDKDVALAIRYAVNNGATVINISFGKSFSPHPEWVESAIYYASKKDVLIIMAAGNSGVNIDSIVSYPTSKLSNGKRAANTIVVGASGPTFEELIGSFSNYGKNSVDVFAPGVRIFSTSCDNKNLTSSYEYLSGTSMAAPMVSGLATLLRSYYPKFKASQVKEIIEESVFKIDSPVRLPGETNVKVHMYDLCKTGGIINILRAVELAENKHLKYK